MSDLSVYIPQDRLRALARGDAMADRTLGAVLFADISGFVSLTEVLRNAFGARRGAEALAQQLDRVYSALIAEVERHGGSVIDFAGDAMICWYAESDAARRATASAIAMQHALRDMLRAAPETDRLEVLALKVVVTHGPARRFYLGDSAYRLIDVLAGATVARAASGDHLAQRGEVLLDEQSVIALDLSPANVRLWRGDPDSGSRFAVLAPGTVIAPRELAAPEPQPSVPANVLRDWIHPTQRADLAVSMTEFRPCAALFVRFAGIDYDAEGADGLLDEFVTHVQRVAARYDGALIQLTIGDKGSYAYVNFGVLRAHEDVARRAVRCGLELREKLRESAHLEALRIGIASGVMRVGAYGGQSRRAYGALGDDVNIGARLMELAAPDELLVSGPVGKAIERHFNSEPRPPLPMKGKAEPLLVFAVTGERRQRAMRLQEPVHALPMVGRAAELHMLSQGLDRALDSQAQLMRIVADAGMGKTRLLSEAIRLARKKGFDCYGGACQPDTPNTSYQPWKTICEALFDIDAEASERRQLRALEGAIDDLAPARVQAAPLLGGMLSLGIPDNDFTRTLEPDDRRSVLTALLEDCLREASRQTPLFLVIEDAHWIDDASEQLLSALSQRLADCRVCIVQTLRESRDAADGPVWIDISLRELTFEEAGDVIRAKLMQLYPMRTGAVPALLVQKLMARAQGNPYFLEELLNYLHDSGLDPRDVDRLGDIELPDSLHALVLSQIDQLGDHERTLLHAACVIGRRVNAGWLAGYYTDLGDQGAVEAALARLCGHGVMLADVGDMGPAYLFKHTVFQEVAYESMSFSMRTRLHDRLGRYLESQVSAGLVAEAQILDALAYHFSRGADADSQRLYLAKAADAALDLSAFASARDYLASLLRLIPASDSARAGVAFKLAEAHYRMGDFAGAIAVIKEAETSAANGAGRAAALTLLGEVTSDMGDHIGARTILGEAVALARASAEARIECRALYGLGDAHWRNGELTNAQNALGASLEIARQHGDVTREVFALGRLASVMQDQGDLDGAKSLFTDMHARASAAGNRERIMNATMNLGQIADKQGDFALGQRCGHEALALAREIGAQQTVALCLIGQASTFVHLGDYAAARVKLREGLSLAWRIGARPWVVWAVTICADLAYYEGQTERALALYGLAQRQPAFIRSFQRDLDARLADWQIDADTAATGLAQGGALELDATVRSLLRM
jgi:adenylate cyclase